ncbi:DUF6580 family putative transport protein [Mucilaginibacter sp.]|uniref:DUF6580 family putative transport protein n=1 Tax=Mucilaginibacter sp. TaxID=1882438 RepID=UPI0026032D96|nr:DUF6580 family putative transport protein [Mucilaginibacter sp.]MDB4923744.1 hypothetical protein [Mucilaginibacter sp.]
MSTQKLNTRTAVLILIILIASVFRLISYEFPSLSNFTPMGAIALFGGAYFSDKWKAYLTVLLALFVSDIFINYLYTSKWVLYYSGSIWVYLPFLIMVLIGTFIKKPTIANVGLSSIAAVCVHWLVSDLPWFYGTRYPHSLTGYGMSLTAAIPFELNMLMADVLFCAVLFGGFELAKRKYTVLRSQRELAV